MRRVVAAAAALMLFATSVAAQTYPTRPVTLIVPFAAGGPTDIVARITADFFSKSLGQQFIVENRPGAGSTIGTEYVARAAADGYSFLMTSASFSFSPGLYPKLRFDPIEDFVRVSQAVSVPHVIVVLPSFPARNP